MLLLLTTFSALLPLVFTGGAPSPRDFDAECVNNIRAGEFPSSQQPLADLDLYENAASPSSFITVHVSRCYMACAFIYTVPLLQPDRAVVIYVIYIIYIYIYIVRCRAHV